MQCQRTALTSFFWSRHNYAARFSLECRCVRWVCVILPITCCADLYTSFVCVLFPVSFKKNLTWIGCATAVHRNRALSFDFLFFVEAKLTSRKLPATPPGHCLSVCSITKIPELLIKSTRAGLFCWLSVRKTGHLQLLG